MEISDTICYIIRFAIDDFGPRVYPMGSIVIALVRLLFRPFVFKYLGDSLLVFANFLHEVRAP